MLVAMIFYVPFMENKKELFNLQVDLCSKGSLELFDPIGFWSHFSIFKAKFLGYKPSEI